MNIVDKKAWLEKHGELQLLPLSALITGRWRSPGGHCIYSNTHEPVVDIFDTAYEQLWRIINGSR